jgi:hypothetical protein
MVMTAIGMDLLLRLWPFHRGAARTTAGWWTVTEM